jgi:hypothetical protein
VKPRPVVFKWQTVEVVNPDDGEAVRVKAMVPLPRFGNVCAAQFSDGEEYVLAPLEERSMASHGQYFAAVHEAFLNLPETISNRFPSSEHLRKWALIECDWFDEKEFYCPDEAFARGLATFVRTEDEYARISVHRPADVNPVYDTWKVIIRRAKSQSMAAMGKEAFEQSKRAVLDLLEHLTAVDRGALMKNAGRSA